MNELGVEKTEHKDFDIVLQNRSQITAWKWNKMIELFGKDKVKEMIVRNVDRGKLKQAILELKKSGIAVKEDVFTVKEVISQYIVVRKKRKVEKE